MKSFQGSAGPSVKQKWKVEIPPEARGRNEVEFEFVVKHAQAGQVTSDPLFVELPQYRFSV